MVLQYTVYPIAPRGLATSFSEAELPDDYALSFKNRFINAAGGAEKRQGIKQRGNTVAGAPTITGLHELMLPNGTPMQFCSANGLIYRYDNPAWTYVATVGNSNSILNSVQMGRKLIFFGGGGIPFYTEDGYVFAFMSAVVERGIASSGTDYRSLQDANVSNWITNSNVNVNDLVFNQTRGGYGVVTLVTTASVVHTPIGPTAQGIGTCGATAASGDTYEVIDNVELNVIPTGLENDNIAVQATNSSTIISVDQVPDWFKTDMRIGDIVRNATKDTVVQVTAFTTSQLFTNHAISSAGDTLIFLKNAMPIATRGHVHFGRLYMIDDRDHRTAIISGINNPEDVTTDAGTLDSSTLFFGDLQPQADKLQCFTSFQRFVAFCGLRNVTLFQGKDPIADTSGNTDFSVVGLFPQGAVSQNGAVSIGDSLAYVSTDGVQAISMSYSDVLNRNNLSEPLRRTLRDKIANAGDTNIFCFHYPRRSWFCAKIGSELYVYNYTPYFGKGAQSFTQAQQSQVGSWSLFDGLFAQQQCYLVIADGTLLCAGAGGKVYEFDQGTYDDDGNTYTTEYKTGWLSMSPGRRTPQMKMGHYIQPVLDTGTSTTYTITAEAPFAIESADTQDVNVASASKAIGVAVIGKTKIGGTSIVDNKIPLRWRGKECRFNFTTNDSEGPDVLSRFTVYFTLHGVR